MIAKTPADYESRILHETANLYLYDTGKGLEIRLNGVTHSVVVGMSPSIDKAKQTMEKLERYPANLRQFYDHR